MLSISDSNKSMADVLDEFEPQGQLSQYNTDGVSFEARELTKCTIRTSSFAKKKKKPVDFDGELKTGDVRYDNLTKITIKVQLFWRLQYEMWLSS